MQFLKKHYEKIILCVVLLGLAAAAVWMSNKISETKAGTEGASEIAPNNKPWVHPDFSNDYKMLAQLTNPPPVVLSGDHNLFNPVTWRRKPNGELLKILKTGADALVVQNIIPLYEEIKFDHASGGGTGVYVMDLTVRSAKRAPEYAKINEKTKSGLYIIRGIKGASDDPTELELEIPDTGETVAVSANNPYKRVDGYLADLKYPPESKTLTKQKVDETFTLDNEEYKIIAITNNAVRVQLIKNGKVTPINWNGAP